VHFISYVLCKEDMNIFKACITSTKNNILIIHKAIEIDQKRKMR